MSIKEGLKDFLVGAITLTLGILLAAILIVILVLLWPFIAVVGWLVILLLLVALGIAIAVMLIMIVGRLVRGSYGKQG